MAKFTSDNVLRVEKDMMDDLELWPAGGSDQAGHMMASIAGMHDMANAIIKEIKEIENV